MGLFGSSDVEKEAKRARKAEEERQAEIRDGTNKINYIFNREFTPNFFRERERAYERYGRPQLVDQYEDAGDELTFDLARRNLTDSSVRGEKAADLQQLFALNRQDITAKAHEYGTRAQNDVADAQTGLITTLQQTGDAKGAARGALDRADAISQVPAFSPLTDLFVDFTAGLGTQAGLERAYAAGSPQRPRYNLGLYGSPSDSVRVT